MKVNDFVKFDICNDVSFTPSVVVENATNNVVTSVEVSYTLDGINPVVQIDSNINLKNKGVLANHFLDESCYNNKSIRMKVSLMNVSKEPVVIRKDDKIAIISIEPVYIFDWNN